MTPRQIRAVRPWISVLIFAAVAVFSLSPLVWIALTSIKPEGTEYRMPVEYWPQNPTLDNYRTVLGERFRIQRSVLNSVIVSSGSVLGTLVLSTLSAYAIARIRFRYHTHSLYFMQIAGMIPPIVVIAPTFVLMRALGLIRTYWAMIIPNMIYAVPLSSFLISSYFANVPFELEDAAKIDGAGTLRTILAVVLPIAAPGMFSAGVLAFLGSWGEFMLANTVSIGSTRVETVPVAVLSLSRAFELQWTWVAAGTVVTLVPIIAAVLIFQRTIVRGLTAGALK